MSRNRRVTWLLGTLARREAESGSFDERDLRPLCQTLDPLLRGVTRRAALDLLHSSSVECSAHGHPELAARHALLEACGEYANPAEPQALIERAAALTLPEPPKRWLLTPLVVGFAALALVAGLFVALAPDYMLDDELEEPTAAAYRTGGRPLQGSEEQSALFHDDLARWVLLLDRHRPEVIHEITVPFTRGELDREAVNVAHRAGELFSTEIGEALLRLLDAALELVLAGEGKATAIYERTAAFNAALAAEGWGFQLDAAVLVDRSDRRRVLLASFTVEWVAMYEAGDEPIRALRWTRLDELTFTRAALGFTGESLGDARVMMGTIDEWLTEDLLPSMAPGMSLPLVDDDSRLEEEAWVEQIERAAADAARRELVGIVGDETPVTDIGRFLLERQRLFETVNLMLAEHGYGVLPPEQYAVDLERYEQAARIASPVLWGDLRHLQWRLEGGELGPAQRAVRSAMAQTVERHEVQHRLDFGQPRVQRLPPVLTRYFAQPEEGEELRGLRRKSLLELSAYLASLARSPELAHLSLAFLSAHIFDRWQWGGAESFAAVAIIELLGVRHGSQASALIVDGEVDRGAAAAILARLLDVPGAAVAASAAAAWQEQFGVPLPPLRQL